MPGHQSSVNLLPCTPHRSRYAKVCSTSASSSLRCITNSNESRRRKFCASSSNALAAKPFATFASGWVNEPAFSRRSFQTLRAMTTIRSSVKSLPRTPHRVTLRELYVRVLQSALHYELEQASKIDISRKLKKRFGAKGIRDIRFRVG